MLSPCSLFNITLTQQSTAHGTQLYSLRPLGVTMKRQHGNTRTENSLGFATLVSEA